MGVLFWTQALFARLLCVLHVKWHVGLLTTCVLFTHSWNVVHTYKVQFSNDSLVWKPCMNGTEEAVSEHIALLQHSNWTPIYTPVYRFPDFCFQGFCCKDGNSLCGWITLVWLSLSYLIRLCNMKHLQLKSRKTHEQHHDVPLSATE